MSARESAAPPAVFAEYCRLELPQAHVVSAWKYRSDTQEGQS